MIEQTAETTCDQVALFLEGELAQDAAEGFRRHLGACAGCQGALQVGLAVESASAGRPRPQVLVLIRQHVAATALAAMALLAVGGRVTLGLWPVALNEGPARPQKEWVEGPFAEPHRPFEPASRAWMGKGSLVDGAAYDEQRERISWLFGSERRLLATAASALIHRDEDRAQETLDILEQLGGGDLKVAASAFNNRAVLELRRADQLRADSCAEAIPDPEAQAEQEGVCDERMRLLRQALASLERALELSPGRPAALFNRALVLERLGLELSAADSYDAVARTGPRGWAEEAASEAARLRHRIEEDKALIARVERERAALSAAVERANESDPGSVLRASDAVRSGVELVARLQGASRDPEPLRLELYTLARVGTPLQRELLLPLAEALDGREAAALSRRLTRGDAEGLGAHARLVSRYQQRGALGPEEQEALAVELERAGEDELLLGLLTPNPRSVGRGELPVSDAFLANLEREEPFVAIRAGRIQARRALAAGESSRAIQVLEEVARRCGGAQQPERCASVEGELMWTHVAIEQWTQAQAHGQRGLALARRSASAWIRPMFLEQLSQVAGAQNDPWLALAYAGEARRWLEPCSPLRGIVSERMAAIRLYFLLDVPGALTALAEAVEAPGCPAAALSTVGADVLAALVAAGQAPEEWENRLDGALRELGRNTTQGGPRYIHEYLVARATLSRSRSAGRAELEDVARRAERPPGATSRFGDEELSRAKVRSYAYRDLAMEAGAAGDFSRAFEMVARQLQLVAPGSCALAVVSDLGQTVAVAKDERGAVSGSSRKHQWRWVDRRGDLLVPASVQASLRGCRQVKVLASPGVFGLSRVLDGIPWSYAVAQKHTPRGPVPPRRLVVANAEFPPALQLDRLSLLSPPVEGPGTVVLQHRAATLTNVARELEMATEVELYTHGVQKPNDAEGSYLVLTPDPARKGEFRLTGREVRGLSLDGAPVVYLKACVTADAGFQNFEARSLASAFVEAGARAVFASAVSVPDMDADRFFNAVRERIRLGRPPAEALFEIRAALKKDGRWQEWMDDVVCLESA